MLESTELYLFHCKYSERDDCVQNSELLHKLRDWWQAMLGDWQRKRSDIHKLRRADNENQFSSWMQNLEKQKIRCVSPGLLYIRTEGVTDLPPFQSRMEQCLNIESKLVPRDNEMGRVWTPWNCDAISFTSKEWTRFAECYDETTLMLESTGVYLFHCKCHADVS